MRAFSTFVHLHCTKNAIQLFPGVKLSGLVPSFYIHVSGSDLYILMIYLAWNLLKLKRNCLQGLIVSSYDQ
jgi:hypothetical protein